MSDMFNILNMSKKPRTGISEKGLAMTFTVIITVLIFMCMLIAIIVMNLSRYITVHEIVQESTVDRHTLNLGQVLLSHPRLVYYDGNYLYRGVFDKDKLNDQIRDEEQILSDNWGRTELTEEVAYPNSIIMLGVIDYITEEIWTMKYKGPKESETSIPAVYADCVQQRMSEDVKDRSIIFTFLPSIWTEYDLKECAEVAKSNYGTETRVFPVVIKDGDETHPGALYVTMREAWGIGGIIGV